jgi:hypothetical protein
MNKDAIIEKIKKLLRMKRGGTAGEIENALAMAAKLARDHGIDLAGVNPDETVSEVITHVEEVLKLKLPSEAKFASAILVNFFNVQICHKVGKASYGIRYKIVFVGTAWECEVASYMFIFLQRCFRSAWKDRKNKRLKNREAFMHGMFLGLAAKLEESKPKIEPGVGLVAVNRAFQLRNEYLAKLIPNAQDKKIDADDSDAWSAKHAGIIAGRETEIRKGVNGSAAAARPQLPPAAGQLALI